MINQLGFGIQQPSFLESNRIPFIHMSSDTSIRKSWSRISSSPKILIHWETRFRHGGAIVEELLSVAPKFELEDRLIICSDPSPEDLVYLDELQISNVVILRRNQFDIRKSYQELKGIFFDDSSTEVKHSKVWRKLNLSLKSPVIALLLSTLSKLEGFCISGSS